MSASGALRWVVVGVLLAVAVYQITPLKQLCLKHCRSPLPQLQCATYLGRLRDMRVGAHHGLYCACCCWSLFLLLVAVGTMNLAAMLILTAVIAVAPQEFSGGWRSARTRIQERYVYFPSGERAVDERQIADDCRQEPEAEATLSDD